MYEKNLNTLSTKGKEKTINTCYGPNTNKVLQGSKSIFIFRSKARLEHSINPRTRNSQIFLKNIKNFLERF